MFLECQQSSPLKENQRSRLCSKIKEIAQYAFTINRRKILLVLKEFYFSDIFCFLKQDLKFERPGTLLSMRLKKRP